MEHWKKILKSKENYESLSIWIMKHLWLKNVKYRACKSESEKLINPRQSYHSNKYATNSKHAYKIRVETELW